MMNVADTKTKTCQIKCINKIDRFSPYERLPIYGGQKSPSCAQAGTALN
jgi:hypothetical protein